MNPPAECRVIVILGATASGKGALGRELARRLDGEIVSLDSMKIYRGLDIGTAKPGPDERAALPHHLIDVADWWEPFSAARYVELADAAIEAIHARGRPARVVGGTVLYFKSLHEGLFPGPGADETFRAQLRDRAAREGLAALYDELRRVDPPAAARIHANDLRRIERALEVHHLTGRPISSLQQQWDQAAPRRADWGWRLLALQWEREALNRRINARVRRMVDEGLEAEARRVWEDPRAMSAQAAQAVGYKELFDCFAGRTTRAHAIEQIKIGSRRLAKHQRTWLRRLPGVTGVPLAPGDDAAAVADRLLAQLA